jgi:hypothetical protein
LTATILRCRPGHGGLAVGKNFIYNIGQVRPVSPSCGFVRIDATINGNSWTIINTHLESGGQAGLDQLRAGQMTELVAYLPPSGPSVVLGDLNDTPGSLMYQVAAGAGLTDAWAAIHPGEPGLSCCHASDLSNDRSDMHSRIDYVLARGTAAGDDGEFGRIRLLGIRQSERIAGPVHPIWPSDHAGLSATLRAPQTAQVAARTAPLHRPLQEHWEGPLVAPSTPAQRPKVPF